MDSLTQIVLGAACGEAIAGKKIGNKALLYGAIGGTIPDLDVFIGRLIYLDEVDRLAFHRGFMHSIFFAILISFVLAKLFQYFHRNSKNKMPIMQWYGLWFLSIFTHPILDSFTAYGTQLFLPFSDFRVGFNNISVVDPFYTLPFLFCLIMVMRFSRNNPLRTKWLKKGIIISSLYMIFTFINQQYIHSQFRQAFEKQQLKVERWTAQPTLFNNQLWYGIFESKNQYYAAYYSWFDSQPIHFEPIPKEQKLRKQLNGKNVFKKLQWFSDDYYILRELSNKELIFSNLKYPIQPNAAPTQSVFAFKIKKEKHQWKMKPFEPDFEASAFKELWNRWKGN